MKPLFCILLIIALFSKLTAQTSCENKINDNKKKGYGKYSETNVGMYQKNYPYTLFKWNGYDSGFVEKELIKIRNKIKLGDSMRKLSNPF